MTAVKKLTGAALACAAAGIFVAAGIGNIFADKGMVRCEGVNACKGKSDCKSAKNACTPGQNACKGQGYVVMSEKDCKAANAKAKAKPTSH